MKVTMLDYQLDAIDILIFTKNTRLRQEVTLEDIKHWPYNQKLDHLEYMKHTIQSSFEFVRYIFNIEGVSRNFTHQLVRTRNACYAQESQRTVDVRNSEVLGLGDDHLTQEAANLSMRAYGHLIDCGVPVQDARSILPTGIETSITMGVSLRELMHMGEVRLCTRTQGEYQEVFKAMKAEVLKVHPYFKGFIEVYCVKHGTCCFPNYKECPVQEHVMGVEQDHLDHILEIWENTNHVANPVAKDGKTM